MKSKYKGRIKDTSDYAKTIDDFDKLIDPQTLARHFLGPDPFPYILRAIAREEKSKFLVLAYLFLCEFGADISFMAFLAKMTTKFNQEMYAKLRARKNEPLSSIGQKQPRVAKEVVETTASTPIASDPKVASPVVTIEGITPRPKRAHGSDKRKSKIDSNVWDNAATSMGRTHNVVTPNELKSLSVVPSHKLVNCHVHKLVQVLFCPNLFWLQSSWFFETILTLFILY